TAGLYVGICWILIEVASVVLPTFDTPEWVFRAAIIVAVAGFPVMLVFAWVFDVTKEGIHVQADPTHTIVEQLGARRTDFVVIGVLAVALAVSLYLNVANDVSPEEELEPVSVLIANFENTTDEPSFDSVLEEALLVGLEAAPHIAALDRSKALQIGRQIKPDASTLDLGLATLVAQREGIKFLLAGSLQQSGSDYRITVDGIDVSDGQKTFTIDEKADSRDAVLQAIGNLSAEAREELGDATVGDQQDLHAETFVAASFAAARAYESARQFQIDGKLQEAAEHYKQAIELDPQLGRAFSGLALAEFALGQTDQAEERWTKALSLMDTMTERERLRFVGRYYTTVAENFDEAVRTYSELVEKYPADVGARESLAAASFRQLDFVTAVEETRKILEIFPASNVYRTKLALYAMYEGDWETAATEAGQVIAADPANGTAYLPVAMAALAQGQVDASRDAYRGMASTNRTEHGASVAELGLADIDMFIGQISTAQERLLAGIDTDIESGNQRAAAVKHIALAQSYAEQEKFSAATTAAANALQLADGHALNVPAAMIYIKAGDLASARAIIDELIEQAHAHSRAYGQMLLGMILESEGDRRTAVFTMREAIRVADLWLIRRQLGKAYLRDGHYPEALDELMMSKERAGEGASAFLDDMPTYRLVAELPYWIGRAQEELKMQSAAQQSYEEYVDLRPQGGALAQDAIERAAKLN
ncbi:MAG: tetratricopeptide repeat protein, partial [Woeseiaceae bacterium]